jgi:hypothetical protein
VHLLPSSFGSFFGCLRRPTATNSLGGAIEDLRLVCARPQFQLVEPSPVDTRSLDLRSHSKPVFGMGYDATLAPSLDRLSREADLVKEAYRETPLWRPSSLTRYIYGRTASREVNPDPLAGQTIVSGNEAKCRSRAHRLRTPHTAKTLDYCGNCATPSPASYG